MISIIIPIYNRFHGLSSAVLNAKVDKEIILVDDGSTDDSAKLCAEYAESYSEVKFISKSHTGVSDTRNTGICAAKGKYIMFLDADDDIKAGSIEALVKFFDSCYDIVDLVTYPLVTNYHGCILPSHFRYKTMTYTGIYDLYNFPYIGQTTMNIVVKNLGKDNILFDISMDFEEDQKYCCDVLQRKMKMGFCKEALYIYYRSEDSSSGRLNGSCYIFEQAMKMFEELFSRYSDTVPLAIQGLYINDLEWKMRCNILYPWHYNKADFEKAERRIVKLLNRVDNSTILNHPEIDEYHKFYWISKKINSGIEPFFKEGKFGLKCGSDIILEENKPLIVVTRIRVDKDIIIFRGFLKSRVFSFCEKPELYAITEDKTQKLDLYISSHSYYLCHTQTNKFYAFCLEIPKQHLNNLKLQMKINDFFYDCTFDFHQKAPFSKKVHIYDSVIGTIGLHFSSKDEMFSLSNYTPQEVFEKNTRNPIIASELVHIRKRAAKIRQLKQIYLYYDCRGVEKDNGYYRFIEDFSKNDGIERYYIYDPEYNSSKSYLKNFSKEHKSYLIPFGSRKHKIYTLAAKKLITAFVEDNNILPFEPWQYPMISDFFGFTVEYLQHGILHASVPWKYTPESVMADKIYISTEYERKLFVEKYHFRKEDLIIKSMPRWDKFDKFLKPKKMILFAPSWRKYLIGSNINGKWQPRKKLFETSDYYKNICKFLNSDYLHSWLSDNGYMIDFKLHPIFDVYKDMFVSQYENIHIVDMAENIEQYEMLITDISSFAFDFLFLGRKVFSYIPDKKQFYCGMNSYREIEPESYSSFIKIESAEDFCKKVSAGENCISNIDFIV